MIVSSTIARAELQKDGRSYVTELHSDDARGTLRFEYLADAGADHAAILKSRAATLNAEEAAVPVVQITHDDGTVSTFRAHVGDFDFRLTNAQKTALVNARNVIEAARPFVALFRSLTPPQQQFVLAHTPWLAHVLTVLNG
jgi:hypothetical protein